MDEKARFRLRLRRLFDGRYPSLDRFSRETGFSKGHLSQILRGHRTPSLATIVRLAGALGVDLVDLFSDDPVEARAKGGPGAALAGDQATVRLTEPNAEPAKDSRRQESESPRGGSGRKRKRSRRKRH
ncbi:MAG: helix-turn-helix transcriptional regulator [Deltaproteobacteria bacterium]|nr:helix-turn-helix transcriptional regulator [Deltaproteobacteria bacterium]